MSLTAVITVSVKFHLFRFKIFGFGVSPKILFRSHTTGRFFGKVIDIAIHNGEKGMNNERAMALGTCGGREGDEE